MRALACAAAVLLLTAGCDESDASSEPSSKVAALETKTPSSESSDPPRAKPEAPSPRAPTPEDDKPWSDPDDPSSSPNATPLPEPEPDPEPEPEPVHKPKPPRGVPGGVPGGVPAGVVGGVVGGSLGGAPPSAKASTKASPKQNKSLATVMANAIYSPDPKQSKLAGTKAGLEGKPLTAKVSFCVNGYGKIEDVKTSKKSGDADVDRICRDTVTKWRFKPFIVGGKPIKTCTTVKFSLKFA